MRVVLGASLGILVTAWVCRWAGAPGAAWPWLIAPMGASAVLVFAVPASPLAQPWAVVGGNTLSALIAVVCIRWIGSPEYAVAPAVGLAIGLMFAMRCLHPPGGATALLVALNGVDDARFALAPVLLNSMLLVLVGMAYNHATGRAYPQVQWPARCDGARDEEADAVDADLDKVLARYNQVLDISRDDLKALLQDTQLSAYQRKLAHLRCSDIMSRKLITVGRQTPLHEAWMLFREHRIKALPVVDASGGVVGIVTPADFMRAAEGPDSDTFDASLRRLREWAIGTPGLTQGVVGQIMTRAVRVASVDRHLAELIPLFGSTGHHHIPIVDRADRLVGIVTQSDVVAALSQPPAAHE
ncbi:MAG: HPP family protein [Burkholderiaceae bacterium]|nr:HPP family protein [Burkholderiaceae bacterium]